MKMMRPRRMLRKTKSLSAKLQFLLDVLMVEGLLLLGLYFKNIHDFSLYYYPALAVPFSDVGHLHKFWCISKVLGACGFVASSDLGLVESNRYYGGLGFCM